MGYIIVIRQFEKNDEEECNALLQKAARSLTNTMIKDSIFTKLLYLFVVSMMLYNFGVSKNVISLLVMAYAVLIYIKTYSTTKCIMGLKRNIWRNYLDKPDCKIWVAEALEPLHIKPDIKDEPYTIIPDYEYRHFEMSFRFVSRKIVGIVGVSEFSKNEANINMLFVHNLYAGKNIEEKLLDVAVTYVKNKKYFGVSIQLTEYHRKMIQKCLQYGFTLKHTYDQNMSIFLDAVAMYELTCHKMPEDNVDKWNYIAAL